MIDKPHKCGQCSKRFASPSALKQHRRDAHNRNQQMRSLPKEVRKSLVEDIGDDMPDGAFWALADEFGLDAEDFS